MRCRRYAHWAWPGTYGAVVSAAALVAHVLWRRPAEVDLLVVACLVTFVLSGAVCFLGTLGRIEIERDGPE